MKGSHHRQTCRAEDVIFLFREQQKLLKALENLEAGPSYNIPPSVKTDPNKQPVSQSHRLAVNNPNTAGCDGDIRVQEPLWMFCAFYPRQGCPRRRSPLHCMLPWRSCQTGGARCRSGWLSCSSSASETRSSMCLLTTSTSGTLTTPGIWGRSLTERSRWACAPSAPVITNANYPSKKDSRPFDGKIYIFAISWDRYPVNKSGSSASSFIWTSPKGKTTSQSSRDSVSISQIIS